MKVFKWSVGTGVLVAGIVLAVPVLVIVAIGVSEAFSALGGGPRAVTPDRTAMLGVWTNPDGARLVLFEDGSCVVSGVPKQTAESARESFDGVPPNGSGKWQVEPLGADSGNSGGIDVNVGDYWAFFSTTGDPKDPGLSVTIGDPDDADDLDFTKQPG